MALLIDCYNVLHADPTAELTTDALCRQLSTTHWTRFGIVVACDGRPKPLEIASHYPGVEVIHSGPTRSADDVLIDLVEIDKNPRRLVVVTNDRAIRSAARSRRANVWSSEEFLQKLASENRSAAPTQPPPAKLGEAALTEQQVNDWLEVFGFDPDDDASDEPESPAPNEDGWPPW